MESHHNSTQQRRRGANGKENKMGIKLYTSAIALVLFLASAAELSEAQLFDVTKYGGKADGKTDLSPVREITSYLMTPYILLV